MELVRAALPAGEPYILLGESFSGPIALALAAERPHGSIRPIINHTDDRHQK